MVSVEFMPLDSCALVDERPGNRPSPFPRYDLVTYSMEEPDEDDVSSANRSGSTVHCARDWKVTTQC